MRRSSLSFIVPFTASLLGGCVIQSGSDADDDLAPTTGTASQDLNELGCVPSGVVDAHALCLCGDLNLVGNIEVLRGPSEQEASLGVNGRSNVVDSSLIEGSWHAYGGFDAVTSTDIQGDLVSAGNVTWVGDLHVARDLVAGGSVDGVGHLTVGGQLQADDDAVLIGDHDIASVGKYPGNPGAPCHCDGPQQFDVARAVADARSSNDNEEAGLPVDGIQSVGDLSVSLSTGRYYLGEIASVGDLSFDIEGDVALFVEGSIQAVGSEMFHIAEGGSLDLYVAGSVHTVGNVSYGASSDPGAFRLLIGGEDSALVHVGDQTFHGQIYAPNAAIDYVGGTEIHGALLARDLVGVGHLTVVYGGAVSTPAETCDVPYDGPK